MWGVFGDVIDCHAGFLATHVLAWQTRNGQWCGVYLPMDANTPLGLHYLEYSIGVVYGIDSSVWRSETRGDEK